MIKNLRVSFWIKILRVSSELSKCTRALHKSLNAVSSFPRAFIVYCWRKALVCQNAIKVKGTRKKCRRRGRVKRIPWELCEPNWITENLVIEHHEDLFELCKSNLIGKLIGLLLNKIHHYLLLVNFWYFELGWLYHA